MSVVSNNQGFCCESEQSVKINSVEFVSYRKALLVFFEKKIKEGTIDNDKETPKTGSVLLGFNTSFKICKR